MFMVPEAKNREIAIACGAQEGFGGGSEPSLIMASHKFHLPLLQSQTVWMATINGLHHVIHPFWLYTHDPRRG